MKNCLKFIKLFDCTEVYLLLLPRFVTFIYPSKDCVKMFILVYLYLENYFTSAYFYKVCF